MSLMFGKYLRAKCMKDIVKMQALQMGSSYVDITQSDGTTSPQEFRNIPEMNSLSERSNGTIPVGKPMFDVKKRSLSNQHDISINRVI